MTRIVRASAVVALLGLGLVGGACGSKDNGGAIVPSNNPSPSLTTTTTATPGSTARP